MPNDLTLILPEQLPANLTHEDMVSTLGYGS